MPNQVSGHDLSNVDLGIQDLLYHLYSTLGSVRKDTNCLGRGSPGGVIAVKSSSTAVCHSSSNNITNIVLAESLYSFSDTTPIDCCFRC